MDLIAVYARIQWEDDGVEVVKGLAKRWTNDLVWVEFPDGRLQGGGAWLRALRHATQDNFRAVAHLI